MLGNCMKMENQFEYYRIPFIIKLIIIIVRCLLLLCIKINHLFKNI